MAWYDDRNRTTYVATYKDDKALQREVENAAKYGWAVQGAAGVGGHINVGRTAARVALTGGVGLLFGASRSKDKITVTFVRDQAWIARAKFDEANRTFLENSEKLRRTASDVQQRSSLLLRLLQESNALDVHANRKEIENDVNRALKEDIEAQRSATKVRKDLTVSLTELGRLHGEAVAAGAQVEPLHFSVADQTASLAQQLRIDGDAVASRERLRTLQNVVVKRAHEQEEAAEKRDKSQRRLNDNVEALSDRRAALQDAPPDRTTKLEAKLQEAEVEHTKNESELQALEVKLAEQTDLLLSALDERRAEAAQKQEQPQTVTVESVSVPSSGGPVEAAKVAKEEASEILLQIEKMADLHRAGVLTDEEFATKKALLLARM